MKSLFTIIVLLFYFNIQNTAQSFYLDENGVTINCENCQPGDTGRVNGVLYEAVDKAELEIQMIHLQDDLTLLAFLCTSLVTEMNRLFYGFGDFNADISSWDVSNVTDMGGMFYGIGAFNQDISSWDVSNVTDMSEMFYDALDFNQDISSWDVSNVTNMSGMFFDALDFNQDISGWCVENITSEPEGFATNCPLTADYYPVWGTCPPRVDLDNINTQGIFTLYPNPTNSFLTIETDKSCSHLIEITSLNGQLIYRGDETIIDMTPLPKGIYFVTVKSDAWVRKGKVVRY